MTPAYILAIAAQARLAAAPQLAAIQRLQHFSRREP